MKSIQKIAANHITIVTEGQNINQDASMAILLDHDRNKNSMHKLNAFLQNNVPEEIEREALTVHIVTLHPVL